MRIASIASAFANDVEYYLMQQPRQLPSRYLYDALGSALFEAICELPWYGITRAEGRLLEAHARAMFAHLDGVATIVELGPGSGRKLTTFVGAGRRGTKPLDLRLVDISPSALEQAAGSVAVLENVRISTYAAAYEPGLAEAIADTHAGRALVLLLGSNIGNFDRPGAEAFLLGVRGQLRAGDALLVGADLVKPESTLLLAYDDPLGVTAAFDLNLLVRINRELGGDFDLAAFEHEAVWNAVESRVEMHLVSRTPQRVRVEASALDFTLDAGESIWTESSYKYEPLEVVELLGSVGFRLLDQWIDGVDRFALTLVEAA
jgi:dimethylhistidine N-methyltransferase